MVPDRVVPEIRFNIKLGLKWLKETNTLAYNTVALYTFRTDSCKY